MLAIQKKLTNTFYSILSLPSTAMGFALCIQISALSWILKTKYNLDIHEIGFVWAAGPLAGILGQPIVGLISDKVWFWGGRRRPFIIIGATLASLMLLALPNIDKINDFFGIGSLIVVALIVALSLDLAINISFNPTRSIIADVTPDGVPRTKGYTWMQTISGSFGVAAYFIGAVIGNYELIYIGVFIVFFCSIIPLFFIEEPKVLQVEEKSDKEEVKKTTTQWGQLIRLYLAHGFSWIGIQTMFVYIIAYITQKIYLVEDVRQQLTPEMSDQIGQVISISFLILNAVGFILPALVLEPITEKLGRVKTHLSCVAIMALGYFGIVAFVKSAIMLYIFMAICGIGWAAVVSLPFAIMSEKVDKSRMGFFMGIFNLSVVIPQLIASLVLGTVIQNVADKNIIFIISGVTLAISAVLWVLIKEDKKSAEKIVAPASH
ncbi:MAG: MFS transporter [Ignavibacteriales bacterium]|nr:MAG: MFS transporter [Ignavibacteriales bacterium]